MSSVRKFLALLNLLNIKFSMSRNAILISRLLVLCIFLRLLHFFNDDMDSLM